MVRAVCQLLVWTCTSDPLSICNVTVVSSSMWAPSGRSMETEARDDWPRSRRPMPDGSTPEPGGWNRIHLIVDDIDAEVDRLRTAGVRFRNDIVTGPGGRQILLEDPSGNPVELFQPAGA